MPRRGWIFENRVSWREKRELRGWGLCITSCPLLLQITHSLFWRRGGGIPFVRFRPSFFRACSKKVTGRPSFPPSYRPSTTRRPLKTHPQPQQSSLLLISMRAFLYGISYGVGEEGRPVCHSMIRSLCPLEPRSAGTFGPYLRSRRKMGRNKGK